MTDTPEKLELPLGAIENGREHFRRLVDHYNFSCEAGALWHCVDFNSAKQCFEFLTEHVERANHNEAALRTQLAAAEARGRNKGLEEAAHLAWGDDDTDRSWLDWGMDRNRRTAVSVSKEIATAIRALMTKPTDSEETS